MTLKTFAAVLTPLNPDFSCNTEVLVRHTTDLLQRGCSGIVLLGTTGEGPSFSLKERQEIVKELFSRGLDPKKTIIANGSSPLFDTVELARTALSHGCETLLIAPPSFFKNLQEEGVISFYREIIKKVSDNRLKVLLYHIPQFTGVPITLKIIQTLRKEFPETIIGIKESEGNLPFAKAIIDTFPGFNVFVGNDRQIIEAVEYGAAGSICGITNLYPELICSLCQLNKEENAKHQAALVAFSQAKNSYSFVAVCKAIMERRNGDAWKTLRPPLLALQDEEKELLISRLEKAGLEP